MPTYTVRYYAGTYNGTRTVNAADDDDAKDKVRAWVHSQMTIPMYSEGYSVQSSDGDDDDE